MHHCPICGKEINDFTTVIKCEDQCKDYFHQICVHSFPGKYISCGNGKGKGAKKMWTCARTNCEVRFRNNTSLIEITNAIEKLQLDFSEKMNTMIKKNTEIKEKVVDIIKENRELRNSMQYFNAEFEILRKDMKEMADKQIVQIK